MAPMDTQPFWARPLDAVLADLATTPAGLSRQEALARLKRFGPNEPAPPRRFEPLREIAAYLVNPLVLSGTAGRRGSPRVRWCRATSCG